LPILIKAGYDYVACQKSVFCGVRLFVTDKMQKLKNIKCFLMDMDGTIYLGDQLLPGAKAWIGLLTELGLSFYFLTNNSSRSRLEYARKLVSLGLDISEEKIFTSGEATALFLQKHFQDAALYVVGTPLLVQSFERFGFSINVDDPDVVVLGFDTTLTYDKLRRLCELVAAGKPYIATHPDINCPTETGFMPDIGSMIELVAASTGRRPDVIIGKPYEPIVAMLTEKTGFSPDALCMVGDRLYTDIALGKWGITTALVLSGETKAGDLSGSQFQPDFVVQDIAEMTQLLKDAYV
jgi:4-nitrophenyl phosphatase/NagD protein